MFHWGKSKAIYKLNISETKTRPVYFAVSITYSHCNMILQCGYTGYIGHSEEGNLHVNFML